ncbi:hypothetical protein E3N88_37430 [Mikania micrantha]|uniref:Reverse transcriptase Ty1/copia-type domain-containing protein n=1 Tax=Mikania micrantha TaxID=192012 RepID=A0A5N6LR50_9ASTR|nr:hypothetical protein E3N88_37430 [Mikania micrantha]
MKNWIATNSSFESMFLLMELKLDGGLGTTGKTLAFILPILQSIINGPDKASQRTGRAPTILVLLPTRELVMHDEGVEKAIEFMDEYSLSQEDLESLMAMSKFQNFQVDEIVHDEDQEQLEAEEVEPRRSKRQRIEKSFGPDFLTYMVQGEPQTYRDAVTSLEGPQWKEAIKNEIDSILQNHTWELVDIPPGCKPLGYRWIFKRKMKADGSIDKYKARLVIKGFRQKEGVDYFDTYSPVTRITSIRLVLAIAALRNLEVHQMDVKTAFLNGDLEEEIYMEQPEGFSTPGQEGKVCKLVKSLYGLKQAPKQWHQKFDQVMLNNGFKINECDKCVYVKNTMRGYVILCLYVDDMLIVGTNDKMIKSTKDMLKARFDMKDMGLADVNLGIKFNRTQHDLVLSQSHYVDKILEKFNEGDTSVAQTPVDTTQHLSKNRGEGVAQLEYSRIIGSLMYLMTCTRPDLAYAVSRLSRYTSNPSSEHWKSMTRLLRYLRYTRNYGLHYGRDPAVIEGYSDANWISDMKDSKSTSGYVFTLGGAAIAWKSSKQTLIARPTMESEFIALDKAGEEAEWLRQFVEDVPGWSKPMSAICIHCDCQSAIGRAQSAMYNGKSRHIRRRHNTIRQLLSMGVISIDYVRSKDNIADPFTKGLSRELVHKSSKGMGLKPFEQENNHIEVLALPSYTSSLPSDVIDTRLPDVVANMKEVRYIYWDEYPSSSFPANFEPTKLGCLMLINGRQVQLWQGKKLLPNLKILDLCHSSFLKSTPDFSGVPCLERLILDGCESLVHIDPSIGYHERLVYVSMKRCLELIKFPSIMRMKKLETLDLSYCFILQDFPHIGTHMDCLENLHLIHTDIKIIPESVGKFCTNLVSFDLSKCENLERIDGNFRLLKRLKHLHLKRCWQLEKLGSDFFDKECCLEVLSLTFNSQESTPTPVENIMDLEGIRIIQSFHQDSSISTKLPQLPRFLRKLHLSNCNLGDGDIPSDISGLTNLKVLYLHGNKFSRLDSSLSRIPCLKLLNLSNCYNLVELPDLPPSIAILQAEECDSLQSVGDLSCYKCLWKVSLQRWNNKLIGGERLLHSMLELPHNWYNDFNGFLLFADNNNRWRSGSCIIVIRQEMSMNSQPDHDQWEAFDKNKESYEHSQVGYVPFSSLRRTPCWNSASYTNVTFQIQGQAMANPKIGLVPRRSVIGECSKFWDKDNIFKRKTFEIIDDTKSSNVQIVWNHGLENY